MPHIIDVVFNRAKVTLMAMVVLVILGASSFLTIPREADPDVPLPNILVMIPLPGISPEDAERLLIKPTETEVQSIEGLIEIDAKSFEGIAQIVLEFEVTADIDKALVDVRNAVDTARAEFPRETLEPIIKEFNAQELFPIISVILHGDAPERTLTSTAKELQDAILAVPGVLDAELAGARDELLEIIIDPETLAAYGLSEQEVANAVRQNNALITAGSARFPDGVYSVKLTGLIKTIDEALTIPVRSDGENVVTLGDIAEIRRTFEDREGYARFNGKPAIGLNVSKRSGANIIEMTEGVKQVTVDMAADWPDSINYSFVGDQSYFVDSILSSLTSSIMLAILLVMIIVVAALGTRSAVMVGFAIPSSFIIGMFFLSISGYTLNMLVMFAMVLSVGMLVDGAIVVVEYADRRMAEGASRKVAYADAAKRMFWPIVASTATTLAAFVPFLFWQDIPGKFMRYLPITLIFVLSSSLFVALVFLPLIGSVFAFPEWLKKRLGIRGKTDGQAQVEVDNLDPTELGGATGAYARLIQRIIQMPVAMIAIAALTVFICLDTFNRAGPESEFFIRGDSEQVFIIIQGRGNLSEDEKLEIASQVREKVQNHPAIESIYTQTGPGLSRGQTAPVETIAQLNIDLFPYEDRERSSVILDEFRVLTAGIPGVVLEVGQPEQGPPTGKDVQVEIVSADFEQARRAASLVRAFMEESKTTVDGLEVRTFMDLEDNQPLPGIEWAPVVDREQAGRFGVSVGEIGSMIQLVTDGLLIDKFRPDDAEEEMDIRIRFPEADRTLSTMQSLTIQTADGPLPISNFVEWVPRQQVDRIIRRDGRRVMDVKANGNTNVSGHMVSQDMAIAATQTWLDSGALAEAAGPGVTARLIGSTEDRDAAGAFFIGAMTASMFMIGAILLLQFNSFYHAALTLSAVVLSVIGVLFGIGLTGQYISVIMTGTGIVALAGIVVNNNIVLIDTYQHLRTTGLSVEDAAVRTAAQRVRPVLLTTITTIMGLLPMVFEINVRFGSGQIGIGNATSDWWVLLSSAVVYGLAFSTLLTLILTPVMLAAPTVLKQRIVGAVQQRATLKRLVPQAKDRDGPDHQEATAHQTAAE